jgi:hypothetical protein
VSCTWDTPPSSGGEVTGVADDDGTGTGQNTECHEGNNLTFIDGVGCDQVE